MNLTIEKVDNLVKSITVNDDIMRIIVENTSEYLERYKSKSNQMLNKVQLKDDTKIVIYLIYSLFNSDIFNNEVIEGYNDELKELSDSKEIEDLNKLLKRLRDIQDDSKFVFSNFENESKKEEVNDKLNSILLFFNEVFENMNEINKSMNELNNKLSNFEEEFSAKMKLNDIVKDVKENYNQFDKNKLNEYKFWLNSRLLSYSPEDLLIVKNNINSINPEDYINLMQQDVSQEEKLKYSRYCDIRNTLEIYTMLENIIVCK